MFNPTAVSEKVLNTFSKIVSINNGLKIDEMVIQPNTTIKTLKQILSEKNLISFNDIRFIAGGRLLNDSESIPDRVSVVFSVQGGGSNAKGVNNSKKIKKRSDPESVNSQSRQKTKYQKTNSRPNSRNDQPLSRSGSPVADEAGPATQSRQAMNIQKRKDKKEREFSEIEYMAKNGMAEHGKVVKCDYHNNIPLVRLSSGHTVVCSHIRLNCRNIQVNNDVVIVYKDIHSPYVAWIFDLQNDREADLYGKIAIDVSVHRKKIDYGGFCGPRHETGDNIDFVPSAIDVDLEEEDDISELTSRFSKSPGCITAFESDSDDELSSDSDEGVDMTIFINRHQIDLPEQVIKTPDIKKQKDVKSTEICLWKSMREEEPENLKLKANVVYFIRNQGQLNIIGTNEKCYIDAEALNGFVLNKEDEVEVEVVENERRNPKYKAVKILSLKSALEVFQGTFAYWNRSGNHGFIYCDRFPGKKVFLPDFAVKNPEFLLKLKSTNQLSEPILISFTMFDEKRLQVNNAFES